MNFYSRLCNTLIRWRWSLIATIIPWPDIEDARARNAALARKALER